MSTYVRNGRGSAHSNIPWSSWQRHTPQCVERGGVTKETGKRCGDSCRDSDKTRDMRLHALRTTVTLMGHLVDANGRTVPLKSLTGKHSHNAYSLRFKCPTCKQLTRIADGHADRLISGANGGRYTDINIMMLCGPCNERKGKRNATPALIKHAATMEGKALKGVRVPVGLQQIMKRTTPKPDKED